MSSRGRLAALSCSLDELLASLDSLAVVPSPPPPLPVATCGGDPPSLSDEGFCE